MCMTLNMHNKLYQKRHHWYIDKHIAVTLLNVSLTLLVKLFKLCIKSGMSIQILNKKY